MHIANSFPGKHFVLEDIDSSVCNGGGMQRKMDMFGLESVDTSMLSFHYGDTTTTGLPDKEFDLVMAHGLIHEINDKQAFFVDLHRILKDEGYLMISDAFYFEKPAPHASCTNPFLTHDELSVILEQLNLTVVKEWKRVGIRDKWNGSGREYESRVLLCRWE